MNDLIQTCREIAVEAHAGQMRDDGTDYFLGHVLPVALMVESLCQESMPRIGDKYYVEATNTRLVMVCSAYLHDVVEDCDEWMMNNNLEKILRENEPFDGTVVTRIIQCVDWLTTSGSRSTYSQQASKTEKFELLFRDAPIEACIVKLCDRISNLESMGNSWNQKRQDKYREQAKLMGKMFHRRVDWADDGRPAFYPDYMSQIISRVFDMYNHIVDLPTIPTVTLEKTHGVEEFYESSEIDRMDREWNDISTNEYREYLFPDGFVVRVDNPMKINVSESGGHRILDADGMSWYIPSGWRALRWIGDPHFVM